MRGEGLFWLGVCVSLLGVACAGKSQSADDDKDAGKGGSAAGTGGDGGRAGKGGTNAGGAGTGGDRGGRGGATTGGTAGVAGAAAGSPPRGGEGGAGDDAGRGGVSPGGTSAGTTAEGGSSNTPTTYSPPDMGATWPIESGDPLNSTVPVLAALPDGGVILAGASANPDTVGLAAFEDGILSEAFVARLDAMGMPLWKLPLLEAGLPWAIERSGDDVVIVAPHLPDLAEVSTSYVSKDVYLARVGIDGTIRWEKTVTFDHEITYTYGLAVDSSGAIFLAGGVQNLDMDRGSISDPILVKCSSDGVKLWEDMPAHTGTQGYGNAVAVLSSGDVVMTGAFDLEMTFDMLPPIESTATLMGLPNGFIVRYTTDGVPVWSSQFGGTDFSSGTGVAALGADDFLLSGGAALDLNLGGESLPGEPFTPTEMETFPPMAAFVARLSGEGTARWVTLEKPATYAQVVRTNGGTVFLGGDMQVTDAMDGFAYLRTYDTTNGDSVQVVTASSGESIESASVAVGPGLAWVAGRFTGSADFGNANALSGNAGVFLLRLDAM
jgi:hypothetical protein